MAGTFRNLLRHHFAMNKHCQLQSLSYSAVRQLSFIMSARFSVNSLQTMRLIPGLSASVCRACESSLISKSSYSTSGVLSSVLDKITFKIRMKYPKYILRRSSLRLYLCCVELVDHDLFLREFKLPDTFNSWFRITELHIWLCMVRLAGEGKEGKFLRNNMLQFMWQDIEKKTKKLGEQAASSSARREGIQALSEQFKAILFAYDEGLLSDDKALAGALWRNFFEKDCKDVAHLERMVEYVRKQLCTIDNMESNVMLSSGLMIFSPLYETHEALERNKEILAQIMKRL